MTRSIAAGILAGAIAGGGLALAAANGRTTLPTEWRLSAPDGQLAATGTLPVGAAFSADGRRLVVVENGQAGAGVRIFAPQTLTLERAIPMHGATGDPLPDGAGAGLWISGAGDDTLLHLAADTGVVDRTIALPHGCWAAAVARAPGGATLAVSCERANSAALVDAASGTVRAVVPVGRHPYGIAYAPDGTTLYVANWAQSSVSAIDTASGRVRTTIAVGRHPDHLVLDRPGRRLFVSEADDDTIGVIDLASGERTAGANAGPYEGKFFGASPSALALSPDGTRLYVADAAANAVAALDVRGATPHLLGAVPAGWYPTAVVVDPADGALDVVDGKGESSRPNPRFSPFSHSAHQAGYVAREEIGSVRRMPAPDDAALARALDDVRENAAPGLAAALAGRAAAPAGTVLRADGPLHHVIYVIKENRTYDQVLGDVARADGDPALALFDATVTPNQHALAERFGILDNLYADAEVSADGHNWSMAAFANDYLERNWPANYGGRRDLYDFEDGAEGSIPHSGYLWDAAQRAGITLRNYGEFTTAQSMSPTPHIVSHMDGLAAVTDPLYPGFDLSYSDLDREAEWQREFASYVASGSLPQLEIVRLPNDHTSGTRAGALTPSAYVAQNDLALGRLVEAVSHSPYWRDTAIFVVEDDAQNGPDHVDDQRMPAYAVSAYAAGGVAHEHYSTAGVVRSIELILGLPPLSAYDAAARPLYAAFGTRADVRPFEPLPERTNLTARNGAAAYGARRSAVADFSREDRVPDAELNTLIWRAVRGRTASLPRYGAFAPLP